MKTYERLPEVGSVNLLFDQAMYSLYDDLARITQVLGDAGVPYELIGGVAVLAHILNRDRSRSFVTRDIDLLVSRDDLGRLVAAAEAAGYQARKIMGGYMVLRPGQNAGEAVHIVFAGERSKSTQPLPHPEVAPVWMTFFEMRVPVAPLADLVRMKLTSFRAKDQPHLELLDETGLITGALEAQLPEVLRERLAQARAQWLAEKPDVEE